MKKIKMLAITTIAISTSQISVQAATVNENFSNGVPFKQLSIAIESNATAIESLTATTTELRSDLDTLTSNFNALESRVSANEINISGIKTDISLINARILNNISKIKEVEESTERNATEIAALKTQIETDVAAINELLNQLRTELDTEKAELDAFISQVETTQAATQNQIQSLTTEINSIKATLATKADISLVEQSIANLHISDIHQQMFILTNELIATKDRLTRSINRFCSHTHYYNSLNHDHLYYDDAVYYQAVRSTGPIRYLGTGMTSTPSYDSWYGSCYY